MEYNRQLLLWVNIMGKYVILRAFILANVIIAWVKAGELTHVEINSFVVRNSAVSMLTMVLI